MRVRDGVEAGSTVVGPSALRPYVAPRQMALDERVPLACAGPASGRPEWGRAGRLWFCGPRRRSSSRGGEPNRGRRGGRTSARGRRGNTRELEEAVTREGQGAQPAGGTDSYDARASFGWFIKATCLGRHTLAARARW